MRDTAPLSLGEKLLNQRLLAETCMTEERVQELWKGYHAKGQIEDASSLQDSLVKCNSALQMANLEIVGIVFPHASARTQNTQDDDDDNEAASPSLSQRSRTTTKYLAMIHKHTPNGGDSSTQQSASRIAFVKPCLGGPMAMKHRRAILEHLAHHATAPRSTLINLKNELRNRNSSSQDDEGDTASSMPNYSLDMAEQCLNGMVHDQWLVSTGGKRRESMKSHLALGPRSFLELSDILTDQFGLEESALPQQLYYR